MRVHLARDELPQGVSSAEEVYQSLVRPKRAPALLLSSGVLWKALVAWSLNLTLLMGSLLCVAYVMLSRSLLPRDLQAVATDETEWHEAFVTAFALATLNSLLLIDGLKVLCLTVTCVGGPLETCIEKRCKWLRKPIRKLYKLVDVMT